MVKGDHSPFDKSLRVYWAARNEKHSPYPKRVSFLLKVQKSVCPLCKRKFVVFDSDSWEVDHITPRAMGGNDNYSNLQLLHKHCHIAKTTSQRFSNNRQ